MDWEQLTAELRDLGGYADNVRLGTGRLGRGVFVVDPAKPARLYATENLLVPVNDVEIREGQLVVKAQATLGDRERDLFNRYQQQLGWGAGVLDDLWRSQDEWSRLPADVVAAIQSVRGQKDPGRRFLAPSLDVCFHQYLYTRQYVYRGATCLTPLVELANHSSAADPFILDAGIGIKGTFADEMLVCYNLGDAWKRAMGSGFSDPAGVAHSLEITVDIDGRQQLVIGRNFAEGERYDGVRFPRVSREGNAIRLPYLTLGSALNPDLPRAIFRRVMSPNLTVARADETFDSIAAFNRTKFISFLRTLRAHDGPLVRMLEDAATNQLEALSSCVGARSLDSIVLPD